MRGVGRRSMLERSRVKRSEPGSAMNAHAFSRHVTILNTARMRLLDTRTSTMARTTAFRVAFLVVACAAIVARTDDAATTSHVQAITEENAHLIEEGEWMLEL